MENKQLSILAIDDNPDNLTVLKAVIKDVFPGVSFLSALNGKKGLELAASDDPDVILLDIIMPGMDGFEVCRALKKNDATQVIPVIFLTSMSNSREVRWKALEAGAEGFLCKPFDETELLAQIQTMAKIKKANLQQKNEKKHLQELVEEQIKEIKEELIFRIKAESDLLLANQKLRERDEQLSSIVENSQDAFFRRKISMETYDYISPSVIGVTGFTDEEMVAMPFEQVMGRVHPDDLQKLSAAMINGFSNGEDYFEIEYRFLDKTEKFRCLWYRSKLVRDEFNQPWHIFGTISNVTERKKAEEYIVYLNYHDHLTGLYNRRFYEEELQRLDSKRNLPLTIIMGDVNGLKLINDSFGHEIGDELLQQVAEAIKKGCRADDIISRYGGDEFIIIMPKTDNKEAEQIINRIQSFLFNEKVCALDISVSFGFATKFDEDENIQDTLKTSEEFMYKHKIYEGSSTTSKAIKIIINALYEKSKREMLHSKRVSKFCEEIALQMNLEADEVKLIKVAGYMHDIGKIGIDEAILNKKDKLSSAEWIEMRKHTEAGYRILSSVSEFSEIADCILEHHERWDGNGYPKGLKGDNINLHARIIAVADSYDAMTTIRTYKKRLCKEEALVEIKQGAGTQFDPEIAKVFIEKVLSKPL